MVELKSKQRRVNSANSNIKVVEKYSDRNGKKYNRPKKLNRGEDIASKCNPRTLYYFLAFSSHGFDICAV